VEVEEEEGAEVSDERFDETELTTPDDETLRRVNDTDLVTNLTAAEDYLKNMKPNLGAIEEFRKKVGFQFCFSNFILFMSFDCG